MATSVRPPPSVMPSESGRSSLSSDLSIDPVLSMSAPAGFQLLSPNALPIAAVRNQIGGHQKSLKGEDVFLTKRITIGTETVDFALVADGHGGSIAAEYIKDHVIEYIQEVAAGNASARALRRAGRTALARLHEEVRATGMTDGSTLTVVMVNRSRSELTTLSLGDSAAILLYHQAGVAETQRLSAEHRLQDSAKERERVASLGGTIARIRHPVTGEPGGPLRCFPGGLAIARGIGDADAGELISPMPATSTVPLSTTNGWDVVICSDGVWDSLPTRDVIKLARLSRTAAPAKTAALIVDAAISKNHAFDNSGFKTPRDDTTCVVMRSRGAVEEAKGGGCQIGERCDKANLSLTVADPVVLDDYVKDEETDGLDSTFASRSSSRMLSSRPSSQADGGPGLRDEVRRISFESTGSGTPGSRAGSNPPSRRTSKDLAIGNKAANGSERPASRDLAIGNKAADGSKPVVRKLSDGVPLPPPPKLTSEPAQLDVDVQSVDSEMASFNIS